MWKFNTKLRVVEGHKFHAKRVGYFQFMGGPKFDTVVLSVKPVKFPINHPKRNLYTYCIHYFAVDVVDIDPNSWDMDSFISKGIKK